MNEHRLPDLELDLGRTTRAVRWGVRITLALTAVLLAAAAIALCTLDLGTLGRALSSGG